MGRVIVVKYYILENIVFEADIVMLVSWFKYCGSAFD